MLDDNTLKQLRQDFPALDTHVDGQRVLYLDNAATSLKPKQVVSAINDYYLGVACNVHRGKHVSIETVSVRYEQARAKLASFINCAANELVFVRNTTEAINLVASGLNLSAEEKVVVFSDSHHANLLPWMVHAKTEQVGLDASGNIDLQNYYRLLDQCRPAVVAITHCSNVTGVYAPLELLVEAAKNIGAKVVVDAAQSVPHRRVNVSELGIDFLAFSAHKMLGPTGIGALYGKAEHLENLSPQNFGGGMVDWVQEDNFQLRKIPHRFEAGTPHIAGAYGLDAAIDYLSALGMERIEQHDVELSAFIMQEAYKRDYLEPINNDITADRGSILSMRIPGMNNLDDLARILSDSYGIMCRHGHLCAQPYVDSQSEGQVLRLSCYFYNTRKDVEFFFETLDELIGFLLP